MPSRTTRNGSSTAASRRSTRRQQDPHDPATDEDTASAALFKDTTEEPDHDSRISTNEQLSYWAAISADDDGMLGGYPQVSRVDIQFSRNFLRKLPRLYPDANGTNGSVESKGSKSKYQYRRCLESGAGIGRVTLNLLASLCEQINIIEPQEKFTAVLTAKDSPLVKSGQLKRVYNVPLQEWNAKSTPSYEAESPSLEDESDHYDLIFNQWCLTYLSHTSLVSYFKSLVPLLAPDGWIIVKENISTAESGKDMYWEEDSSVTRSDRNWSRSFEDAGLRVVRTQVQTGFPKTLLPVRMYALRP